MDVAGSFNIVPQGSWLDSYDPSLKHGMYIYPLGRCDVHMTGQTFRVVAGSETERCDLRAVAAKKHVSSRWMVMITELE